MVNQIAEMAKPHLRHSSLFSKLNLLVLPDVKKLPFTTKAQWMCNRFEKNQDVENLYRSREGNEIPLIIFTEDCADKGEIMGCAHR